MQSLAENIYYDNSYAGVTVGAIAMPQGTLAIDSPLRPEDARSWKATLLTLSRGTHRLMVILDIHADRTLGSKSIEFPIIGHEQTAAAFKERTTVFKGQNIETGSEWEHYPEVSGTRWERPNITFSNQLQLQWDGPKIQIEHHPGPTPGAVWVNIPEEKVVFVGDTVVVNQPPFLARADFEAWHDTLNLLASRQFTDYKIVSGRGGLVTIDDVRKQRQFLKSIHGRLETMAKRKSKPEDTHKMVPALLKKISFPKKYEAFYSQRLRSGLEKCYTRLFA